MALFKLLPPAAVSPLLLLRNKKRRLRIFLFFFLVSGWSLFPTEPSGSAADHSPLIPEDSIFSGLVRNHDYCCLTHMGTCKGWYSGFWSISEILIKRPCGSYNAKAKKRRTGHTR